MKHFLSINSILENLPDKPGVYKFLDDKNIVLYVGKAKNLKKRIRSYFSKFDTAQGKLKLLLLKTKNIEFIVTNSENDAFLLENNLIKTLQPKYNVLLKDDKTYPWIKITNEEYPRILKTRQYLHDGSTYFGPYSSISLLYTLLELIHKLFNIRTCKLNLSKNNVLENKFKACLEYHIGNCKAPCVNKISYTDYHHLVELAEKVLKGELKPVKEYLLDKMNEHASKLEFELAQEYKTKLNLLESYQSKSVVVNPKLHDLDVFTYKSKDSLLFINYLKINRGSIVQSHNFVLEPQLNEEFEDLFLFGIQYCRDLFQSTSKEIIIPTSINNTNFNFHFPKSGDKYKLLQLSFSNLDVFVHQYTMNKLKANYGNVNVRLLDKVKIDLHLKELPVRMECFDISHHSGSQIVASCVVFINGKPAKDEYRHFNIKTINQIDDFAAIQEVVFRRYKRLLDEQKPLPHLIVIDGGKGQLYAACKALELLNLEHIDIISIAKRLEEIFKPNDSLPLYIDKRSETLKLIQRIRNEAHRFAISFHRNKKLHQSFNSLLDYIPNIGEKTKQKLFEHFDSIDDIIHADEDTLASVIGQSKAKIIKNYIQSNNLLE